MSLYLSIVVPVYNRPNEIDELLESLTKQDYKEDYEIVIVEDGSEESSEEVVRKYNNLNINYLYKPNSGPGDSRNYGMRKASGSYYIILDSDVILPSHYLRRIHEFLNKSYTDCFGGADTAHESFTTLQKAINYVMTSFFTTGGIRGGKSKIQKFEPRSFNMGISKEAFEKTKGFARIHPGEDPDLSRRIEKAGFETAFLPDAHVFHKRRISWDKFYTQVKKFGTVRPILTAWHPKTKKITFWFPTLFVLFTLVSLLSAAVFKNIWFVTPLLSYLTLLLFHSTILNKSLKVGLWSVYAVFIQFFGYGIAFLKSSFYIRLLKREPEKQYPNYFFKKN
ncbi:Glycosyltransferase, catalytic subunit of cellulose synthase and poly-beta-1,6-N-acetylglucosamine synthase [Tenacibaculum sp. MAR_2009_124]|uniref:glycosyltransferase n=1 Tax=Tenacibaculum sp. MAR_2009_124 TaxID=1250059 RepID=UPI00089D4F04|nr:glycosyltransferase [Tenacibaculum sp. MAR_2009_124]SEB53436.1 Glycosyltransferase, catalytic subunit of cellulose synthase and poly-beta-1,6-N-acetylglucosamine synthase [Tenacibaculum sp. MAR_2009_124]